MVVRSIPTRGCRTTLTFLYANELENLLSTIFMKITLPEFSLVVLIGSSGSGKSTFAQKHFLPTEVLSSDACRALVSDDENNQEATQDAFDVLHFILRKRLEAGKLTVIDATNVQQGSRQSLLALAREYHALPIALVFHLPERICQERNALRPDRNFGPHVIKRQQRQLRKSLRGLRREGFRYVHTFSTPEEVETVRLERTRLWTNKQEEQGPFDIIGDIHGCFDELILLLDQLGYQVKACKEESEKRYMVRHPEGRKAVFLGDLVDRGPKTPEVLRLVMDMVATGDALCVPGNHDVRLLRKLKGKNVHVRHGLAESLEQLEQEPPHFNERVISFLDSLVSHYVLDGGRLVVAHAGMKEEMQGRASGKVRDFALYGEVTGEKDEDGFPIRHNWAADYRGKATVVYGHTPVGEPEWLNGTINIDTGCVFGGRLTALRYPEKELVSVPAKKKYVDPVRPFLGKKIEERPADLLDLQDVMGRRTIATKLGRVTIGEEQAAAALETISRFAVDPKWLIYLPPTMSPSETSQQPQWLEQPAEAFRYYRQHGVQQVICEEKHMGSRAVIILCRDEETARRRFGIDSDEVGICYTRTGRRFFDNRKLEEELLTRVRKAMEKSRLWEELETDWVVLDCELMPWSAKAQELIRQQYAAVGAASRAALTEVTAQLEAAVQRDPSATDLLARTRKRLDAAEGFVKAYRQYCWSVQSIEDLKLAPFHILATEGAVHTNKNHLWHLEKIAQLCQADPDVLLATSYQVVEVTDPASEEEATRWWLDLTARGGEGMVVKPFDFIARSPKKLIQPALKCRGKEYLRIIYGPEYTMKENLERLRSRSLRRKGSLALREFALGIEALERFVGREPLYRVHECCFGILALESEPVDPRL